MGEKILSPLVKSPLGMPPGKGMAIYSAQRAWLEAIFVNLLCGLLFSGYVWRWF